MQTPERIEDLRCRSVQRVAMRVLGGGPVLAALVAGAGTVFGWPRDDALAAGTVTLAFVWGFLGSIAWVTARGIETAEAVVEHRRLVRSALVDPAHGHLSVRDGEEPRHRGL